MCGIAGIINKRGRASPEALESLARAMADRMSYRGPDDAGVWVDPTGYCALSHRRLSILDITAAGHQPMASHSGRHWIAYNGELYNFLDIKAGLEASGVSFHTSCDTEVLLEALERQGPSMLDRVDAMFAFGLFDTENRRLTLARDAFGEKPLYFHDGPDFFAFASELHALTAVPDFDPRIETGDIATLLCLQYVPAPRTIYAGASKLPPGSFLVLDPGSAPRVERYFVFRTSEIRGATRPLAELADELETLLIRGLERRLLSDVPLGAFLSGGVDSSTVAALITQRLGRQLDTFSIGFENHAESEHHDAAEMARHLGTNHHEQVLAADIEQLGAHIGTVLDEPNGDSSCLPTYLLSRFARERVTVALSGDGGDEMFGGYGRYFSTVDEDDRRRAGDAGLSGWKPGSAYFSFRILTTPDDTIGQLFGGVPAETARTLADWRERLDTDKRPLMNVLRETDAETYMPGAVLAKVDRMSMQHSLEVRAPLIGIDIARFAMSLGAEDCYRDGIGKRVLKAVAERYIPRDWLDRPKRGFGLPMGMWGAKSLLPATRERLLDPGGRLREWIGGPSLERFLDEQSRNFSAYQVWTLFILETWLKTHPATFAAAAGAPVPFTPPRPRGLFARARRLLAG